MGGLMLDFENNLKHTLAFTPAAVTSGQQSASADMLGFGVCAWYVLVGVDSGLDGSNYISLELEESDDDSTFTDVADGDMTNATGGGSGQFALIDSTAEDAAVFLTEYRGGSRYVRAVLNITGTVNCPIGVLAVRGAYKYPPVS